MKSKNYWELKKEDLRYKKGAFAPLIILQKRQLTVGLQLHRYVKLNQ